jgi:drug/metabolite transporter (DMT)-like permease
MSIVWGATIDWIVWQTLPSARIVTGAGIVVAAGLYLMHREHRRP